MRLCAFCSANQQIDPDFNELTRQLGVWAANNHHSIVFGGHDAGLMHIISKAAKDSGGQVIGVVPRRVEELGRLSPYLDVHIPTEDLTDRKDLMMAKSDAFIVLPGGIGTLDELFTVAASATLQYHQKPIILYNMKGFWNSLIACLDDLQAKGMIRGHWNALIRVADSMESVEDLLGALAGQ